MRAVSYGLPGKKTYILFFFYKLNLSKCLCNDQMNINKLVPIHSCPAQPLTTVSIPQHETSEAWGGPSSWQRMAHPFDVVEPGPLLFPCK